MSWDQHYTPKVIGEELTFGVAGKVYLHTVIVQLKAGSNLRIPCQRCSVLSQNGYGYIMCVAIYELDASLIFDNNC